MDGSVARGIMSGVFARAFAASGTKAVADEANDSAKAKDEYTSEPTVWEKFTCFLSGTSYTGGSYLDANGECQVEGDLIPRIHRGR